MGGPCGWSPPTALQLFLPVYLHAHVGLSVLPAAALPQVFSAWLPIFAPPTSLDEYFFFNSLVVRLLYSWVFCQFLLFFVFKFVVVLLLAVRGGTMYLPTPPSLLEAPHLVLFVKISPVISFGTCLLLSPF